MAGENVQRYHRGIAAFESRDLDAFLSLFDSDAEFSPRSAAVEGPFRGHSGIRKWWESMFSAYSDYVAEVEEVRDLGDVTFARVLLRGRGKGSGAPMEQTQWHVAEWRDGRITRWRSLATEEKALEVLGLSE